MRLAGAHDLQRTTAALDDAGTQLSRLFLMQLALNAAFGVVIGVGLWLIGVPSAPLWGMLSMILRFVPYVGALISAIFPLLLAAAVDPVGLWSFGPRPLYRSRAPCRPCHRALAVWSQRRPLACRRCRRRTFWTWLWGPIGLILATPLTICLVVLGRHVDRLKFLEVMLGDQPALTPAELIYQRMLARDPVEATEQARLFLRQRPLVAYYDEIMLEGLKLAQADAERNRLDEDGIRHIRDAVAEIVDDLHSHKDAPDEPQEDDAAAEQSPLAQLEKAELARDKQQLPERWGTGKPLLCVRGRRLLDEAVAMVVAQLLKAGHRGARRAGGRLIDVTVIHPGYYGPCIDLPVLSGDRQPRPDLLRGAEDPPVGARRDRSRCIAPGGQRRGECI